VHEHAQMNAMNDRVGPPAPELVSLDGMLCPPLLLDIKDEYWPHIVNEDFMLNYFLDFDFLVEEVAAIEKKNVLCVFRNPVQRPVPPTVADLEFLGYDLVDLENSASALSNCGGFPDVFANSELSRVGLLPELERAVAVQAALRSLYPEDHHADCHVAHSPRAGHRRARGEARSVRAIATGISSLVFNKTTRK